MFLFESTLNQILESIEMDKQFKILFESKWRKMVKFLHNNTKFKPSAVAKAGSIGKHTEIQRSDLDVIFSIPSDDFRKKVYPLMVNELKSCFGKIAFIKQGDQAIHVDFYKPAVKIDLVLLFESLFMENYEAIQDIRQLNYTQLNAIKLVKYAIYQNDLEDEIPSYLIEQIGFDFAGYSLVDTINLIIQQLNIDYNESINIFRTLSTV